MRIVLVLLLVIAVVAAAGGCYFYLDRPSAVGPLPAQALALPGGTTLLMSVDAKALFGSATYRQISTGDVPGLDGAISPAEAESLKRELKEGLDKGLREAEEKTGVRLDRDVDQLVIAVGGMEAKEPQVALLALGRFDAARIVRAVEGATKAAGGSLAPRTVEGVEVQSITHGGKPTGAFAVPDAGTLVFGMGPAVEETVRNHRKRVPSLSSNEKLMALVKGLRKDSGYFLVVDQPVIERIRREGPGAGAAPFPIPVRLTMAGGFDGGLELTGEMADDAAAKNLADQVKGGLARLQAAGNEAAPAKQLLGGLSVEVEGTVVRIRTTGVGGGAAGLGTIAAIAVPSLLRARVSANEAAAVGDVRTVISAQAAYSSAAGAFGELRCLSEPKACLPGYEGPQFLSGDLGALAEKTGYRRAFFPGRSVAGVTGGLDAFAYTAVPLNRGRTGVRSFCGDSTGIVCAANDGLDLPALGGRCPSVCLPLQ